MKEPFQIPTSEDIENLIGTDLYDVWNSLCQRIEKSYEMELLWNHGGKAWTYEYKYRKGGKTLCALYAKEKTLGFMVILGKDERAKFEIQRGQFSNEVLEPAGIEYRTKRTGQSRLIKFIRYDGGDANDGANDI